MRKIAAIIILAFITGCSGQYSFNSLSISKQTKDIVTKIKVDNKLAGSAVGEGAIRTEQYNNFVALQKNATKAELRELTNHPNGVVRCYAFCALACDTTADLLPIVIRHLNDTAIVDTQFGCIGRQETAGDLFVDIVTQSPDLKPKRLTPAEYEYLDSVLIYTPNILHARERAIRSAKLTEHFYGRVRELVLKENNQAALIALAKFRRKQDIPLILKNKLAEQGDRIFYTYQAICEFPDPAFRPFLRESLDSALNQPSLDAGWRELYNAIANYKDDTAHQLLKAPSLRLKDEDPFRRQYHMDLVFGAVRKYYSPIYDDLLWEMWEHENKITPDIFALLYQQHSEKALRLTKKTIQNAADFYNRDDLDYTEDRQKPVNIFDTMLDTILVHDKPFAVKLINKSINDIDVYLFGICADKALKAGDNSCIKALLTVLEKEDDTNAYLKAAQVLITLNNKSINKQILAVYKRNPNQRADWADKAFAKLLKEHNIKY